MRPRSFGPLFALGLALFLPGSPLATAQSVMEPTDPVLFLVPAADDGRGSGNFTTLPSNETEAVSMGPTLSQPAEGRLEWWWSLAWLPGNGTIMSGTEVEAVIHVAFNGAVPVPNPAAPTEVAAYRVTAALDSGGTTFATGGTAVPIPVDPSSGSAVQEVRVTFTTSEDVVLPKGSGVGSAPVFRFVFGVEGVTAGTGADPVVLVDSQDTPSRVAVPGFPWEAYHAFELDALAVAQCHERVLQQQACEETTPATASGANGGAFLGGGPGIGFLVAIGALCAGAVVAARRIIP